MKITKNDILKIKAGSSLTAQLGSYLECRSLRQWAYEIAKSYPRDDVERYSCYISKGNKITITAIKK